MRVLIAGVGNLFLGDDGFGVEVARRMLGGALPSGVRVVDYGIRGLHLAYALLDGVDLLVVVDATRRGGEPGALYLLEPEPDDVASTADAHGMDLGAVFAAVRGMGGDLPKVRVVGCEPALWEERMGLSAPVQAAVVPAIEMVRELVHRELGLEVMPCT